MTTLEEARLETLRLKLWRSKGRKTRELGAFLLGASVLTFLLAFISNSILFEVTSVLALFLGMIFLFSSVESHVGTLPANMIAKSPLISFKEIIQDIKGRAFYLYDSKNQPRFTLSSDGQGVGKGETPSRTFSPMGRDLLSSYEQELGDLRGKGLDYLAEWLPRLLVESFKLAEQVTFTQVNSREVSVSITKPTFEMLCLSEELTVGICDRVGCQIQGSIGEAITKATEQNVAFGGCVYDAPTRTTTATYRMYPV